MEEVGLLLSKRVSYLYILQMLEGGEEIVNEPPGKPNGGGIMGCTPGFWPSMGFEADCPSAAYEFVIESMTDCAFSCPISALQSV